MNKAAMRLLASMLISLLGGCTTSQKEDSTQKLGQKGYSYKERVDDQFVREQ